MNLPRPTQKLAGCVWLPRILAKARLFQAGALPSEYAEKFCLPKGVDGTFLSNFNLTKEDILAAAALSDEEATHWFLTRVDQGRIEQWNEVAVNLGRPGYPMAERFPVVLATIYKNVADRGLKTVFEVIDADEGNI